MKRFVSLVALFIIVAAPSAASAQERFVTKKSPHSVAVTLDRLSDALKQRGISIVARVDHASAAEKVGEKLEPTQLLIFGNPKLGTPLMRSNQKIGLDLPMKVLAWRDRSGQVWIAYLKPNVLKSDYAISDNDKTFSAMEQALDALTNEAVRAN
ncbi:DUF302 domain-containing protein [Pseudorhodoplanes sp.]|uniref:DUF302 domain-containing protein n=1 Tax=Pseudorhodoplanes sp. TaxID=1934341 RepID=UPI003D0ADE17